MGVPFDSAETERARQIEHRDRLVAGLYATDKNLKKKVDKEMLGLLRYIHNTCKLSADSALVSLAALVSKWVANKQSQSAYKGKTEDK